jgi:hypothetical protein
VYPIAGLPVYWTFKVHNYPVTSSDIKMQVDCGNGYVLLATWTSSGFYGGYPEAETVRWGGTATGMSDDQSQLSFQRESDQQWVSWVDMNCALDSATNWDGNKASATHYTTVKVPNDTTPTC